VKLASHLMKVRSYSLLPIGVTRRHNSLPLPLPILSQGAHDTDSPQKSRSHPNSRRQNGDTADPQISDAHACPTRHTAAPRPTPVPNTPVRLSHDNNRLPLPSNSEEGARTLRHDLPVTGLSRRLVPADGKPGLAVTGGIRDIGQNVLQVCFCNRKQ
jgi:hypothetical protein